MESGLPASKHPDDLQSATPATLLRVLDHQTTSAHRACEFETLVHA